MHILFFVISCSFMTQANGRRVRSPCSMARVIQHNEEKSGGV